MALTGRELVEVTPVSAAGVATSVDSLVTTQSIANLAASGGLTIGTTTITSGTTTRLLYDNAAVVGETSAITTDGAAALTLGAQQTTQGSLVLANTAAGAFATTVKSSNSASSAWTMTLPTAAGASGQLLSTDGSGVASWTSSIGVATGTSLALGVNQSLAAWTTSGAVFKQAALSLTDTSSSGTIAAAYTNLFGATTILASAATTYTNYFGTYFTDPVASTNVTMTNKWALGADSLKIGTSNQVTILPTGVVAIAGSASIAANLTISGGNSLLFTGSGGAIHYGSGTYFQQVSDGIMQLTNNANTQGFLNFGPNNLQIGWLAAANLRQGLAPSATPIAQKFTLGEASRSGTDSNIGGANGTLQSGLGTGTGTLSTLILQSPVAAASGTTAQTYATGMTINAGTAVLTSYLVANLPAAATAGAGATAFVTDASTTLVLGLGGTVAGGGSNKVPVFSDGTNWIYG